MRLQDILLTGALLTGALLSVAAGPLGCETPGQVVSEEASPVCPECRQQTRTTIFKDVTVERHVCRECSTVVDDNEIWPESTIHYCSRCRVAATVCPQCEAQ